MSSAQIFVNTLENFFKRNPFGLGFSKKLEPYCREIGPDLAEEIANRLCETRKAFPDLQTCVKALKAAEMRVTTPGSVGPKPWERPDTRSEWEAKKRAWQMCRCDLGRQADREGWLLSLVEFVTEHQRLPDAREIADLKAWSGDVDAMALSVQATEDRLPADDKRPRFGNRFERWRVAMKDRAHKDVFGFIDANVSHETEMVDA